MLVLLFPLHESAVFTEQWAGGEISILHSATSSLKTVIKTRMYSLLNHTDESESNTTNIKVTFGNSFQDTQ